MGKRGQQQLTMVAAVQQEEEEKEEEEEEMIHKCSVFPCPRGHYQANLSR